MTPPTLYRDPEANGYLDQPIDDPHQQAIVDAVLHEAGVSAGDCVLEVGAGTGRYTRLLLQRELRVIAAEPDETLRGRLVQQVGETCRISASDAAAVIPDEVDAVVGFHVLHHLDRAALDGLQTRLMRAASQRSWKGAAFLEPNPLNLLYLPQIILTSGMRLREEARLWAPRFYGRAVGRLHVPCHVGLVPPGVARRTRLSPKRPCRVPGRWCPWSAYRVVAQRR